MKLLFLGTGAAVAPKTPNAELKPGLRRSASMILEGNALVDISLHSFDYATELGVNTSIITDIFLSHTHGDHYCKSTLMQYAEVVAPRKLNFWCHESAVQYLNLTEEESEKINICTLENMQTVEAAGMKVTALPANHVAGPKEQPVHYIFEKNDQVLFYGCDGGWFRCETWQYLYKKRMVFTAMIFDATVGNLPGNFRIAEHNSVPMLKIMLAALRENGIAPPKATLIADHIGVPPFDMLKKNDYGLLTELGLIVAYDGMELEF